LEVLSTVHILTDLTLGLGKVVYDYLTPGVQKPIRNKLKVDAS
jgi:acetoacetate decarboxylase